MHHARRRMLAAIASAYRGPARRDAPTDNPTDGGAGGGGNSGGTGDPSGQPGTDPAKPPTFTGDFDPERARTAIANARAAEKAAVAAQRASDQRLANVMAALGKNPDGTDLDDPESRAAQLVERADTAEARAWQAGVRLAVHDVAPDAGASAKRLLDSMAFIGELDDLVDDDPDSKEFRAALATKIKAFLASNPDFKAASAAGPGRVGAVAGGSGGTGQGRPKSLREAYARQHNT
jgi:hypothetical protein